MRAAWDHKECLHPQAAADVCDRVVSAHTVQRSGVLERIIDTTNHVLTFYRCRPDPTGRLQALSVGWREASTFTGFCARHDALTFGPLERTDFARTGEQCFLMGYRGLCHEVYQKSGSLKASAAVRGLRDRGQPVQAQKAIHIASEALDAGIRKGLGTFLKLKALMDRQLLEKEYTGWSRAVISFRGQLCVASTGAVSPNRDLRGHELQVLHDPNADQESLLFGVAAGSIGGAVVFIWRNSETAPRAFVEALVKQGSHKLPSILVQFMFAYVENTYFSKHWWDSLGETDRKHIESLAGIANPYYTNFSYSGSQFVPWEITQIEVEDAP